MGGKGAPGAFTFARLISLCLPRIDHGSVSYHMLLARVITRFFDTFARLVSIYLLQIDCVVFCFLICVNCAAAHPNMREDN